MSEYLFTPPEIRSIEVVGETARFPVNRIFCVGRNYAAHAAEMGVEVDREAPFYFTKSPAALVPSGATIAYPPGTQNCHYEMELVIAIGKPAFRVAKEKGFDAIFGFACGLDMTRRDLQSAAKAKQRPWDLGKDFEQSAVMAPLVRSADFDELGTRRIWLSVNGETKQDAHLSDLVWRVEELISHLSQFYHLVPGDLIYTGTPAGVGPIVAGDVIRGEVEGLPAVNLTIAQAE